MIETLGGLGDWVYLLGTGKLSSGCRPQAKPLPTSSFSAEELSESAGIDYLLPLPHNQRR